MVEDGDGTRVRSRRESNEVSGGAARSHHQREDAVGQSCQTQFQHVDFQVRESNC